MHIAYSYINFVQEPSASWPTTFCKLYCHYSTTLKNCLTAML